MQQIYAMDSGASANLFILSSLCKSMVRIRQESVKMTASQYAELSRRRIIAVFCNCFRVCLLQVCHFSWHWESLVILACKSLPPSPFVTHSLCLRLPGFLSLQIASYHYLSVAPPHPSFVPLSPILHTASSLVSRLLPQDGCT